MQLLNNFSFRGALLATALATGLGGSAYAGVNHWTSNGPYGGSVSTLAVDPKDPATVYASANYFGLYKSTDGAASWEPANQGLPSDIISAIAVDPLNTSTVYVGLSYAGGVFKTTDGGQSWRDMGLHPVTDIAIDPRNTSIVFAVDSAGIHKSLDGGTSWTLLGGMPTDIYQLAMDPAHPDILYTLGSSPEGIPGPVYRTADGGATWSLAGSFAATVASDVAVDPGSSHVYVATNEGLFRSVDDGATWVNVLPGAPGRVFAIRASEVYASGYVSGSGGGLLQSMDGGDHWTVLPTHSGVGVAGSPMEPATIYASATFTGVEKSMDGGRTWAGVNQGIRAMNPSIAMDPAHPSDIYAEAEPGLFHSADGGRSWSLHNSNELPYEISIQPGTLDLFSRFGRSVDGGVTWGGPSPGPDLGAPVIAANAPQTMYATKYNCIPAEQGLLYRRVDGGDSWTLVLNFPIGCILPIVSPSGLDVFATVRGYSSNEVFVSHDSGSSWDPIDQSGWESIAPPTPVVLAIDPTNRNVVYAANGGKLWVSGVGGGQWRDISSGMPSPVSISELVVDPVVPTTLYAATPTGVYRSLDAGAAWSAFGEGLPGGETNNLRIDATGRFLHVAAGGSVYDYEVSGACTASAAALCLLNGRFLATVEALDPRTGRQEVGHASIQGDRWGYYSLPGFTGDPNFPEIVVKMADATAFDRGYWLFHTGLTDLQYTLSVVDTVTGRQMSYRNDRSDPQSLCGGADTTTFSDVPVEERAVRSRMARSETLSLTLLDRFDATLSAVDPRTGREADGVAVPQGAKWGYFSLPAFTNDPTFPEVFVKMVDATALPGGWFWVFHTGLTDLEYTLTVTDHETGAQRVYRNDRSDPSRLCGAADTQAFH